MFSIQVVMDVCACLILEESLNKLKAPITLVLTDLSNEGVLLKLRDGWIWNRMYVCYVGASVHQCQLKILFAEVHSVINHINISTFIGSFYYFFYRISVVHDGIEENASEFHFLLPTL